MSEKPAFSGWATKYNIRCTDGKTIASNAFKHMDGMEVPLVSNHEHSDPELWLGRCVLEHRDNEGVYVYAYPNNNPKALAATEAVRHGDVNSFSIFANHLRQNNGIVMHGDVKEVSLVLCGANSGAKIDFPVLTHSGLTFVSSDEYQDDFDEARICTGSAIMMHADDSEEESDSEETVQDVYNTMNEKQKMVLKWYVAKALEQAGGSDSNVKHADDSEEESDSEETIADVYDAMSEKQKTVVKWYVAMALKNNNNIEHSDMEEGEYDMKDNGFTKTAKNQVTISHSDFAEIVKAAKANHGKLSEYVSDFVASSYLQHADGDPEYGIQNIEVLMPDAKNYNPTPDFIKRETTWVDKILAGVTKRPFSRIQTIHADITEDEARAKGYFKGNYKKDEVFKLIKRKTQPTTIYKKQGLDRDDIVDIIDLNVVSFVKDEMKIMYNEEWARAILIGDGRASYDDDKIDESCIRPVMNDEDLYCIKSTYGYTTATDPDENEANMAKAFIRHVIKTRKQYKGSGSPALYTTEDMLTACLLLEDGFGRPLYDTEEKLRTKLRVSEIVTVEPMEGLIRTDASGNSFYVDAILVNLKDYVKGADKGGETQLFEDFDLNFNKEIFLMEGRGSGALVKPFSAITYQRAVPATSGAGA